MTNRTESRASQSLDRYLKEIGEVPLLTAEEEIALTRRIRQGDQEALEKLTAANLRFVVSVAKLYQNRGLSLGDLINEGNLGLMKAATRFDETRGFKFISYAVWWIRQRIRQALADQARVIRLPLNRISSLSRIGKTAARLEQDLEREPTPDEIADQLDITDSEVTYTQRIGGRHVSIDAPFRPGENNRYLDIIENTRNAPPDADLVDESLRVEIEQALASLDPREADIIRLYFGLGNGQPLTLEEIGDRYNLTRERIRQIKEQALQRMRRHSRSKALRPFLK